MPTLAYKGVVFQLIVNLCRHFKLQGMMLQYVVKLKTQPKDLQAQSNWSKLN